MSVILQKEEMFRSDSVFPKFALALIFFFFFARPKFALKNNGNEMLVT